MRKVWIFEKLTNKVPNDLFDKWCNKKLRSWGHFCYRTLWALSQDFRMPQILTRPRKREWAQQAILDTKQFHTKDFIKQLFNSFSSKQETSINHACCHEKNNMKIFSSNHGTAQTESIHSFPRKVSIKSIHSMFSQTIEQRKFSNNCCWRAVELPGK